MIDKITRAITLATIACWECGDRGYVYEIEICKYQSHFIEVRVCNGPNPVYSLTICLENDGFDAIIDQMVLDIAEITKDLV